MAIKYLLLMFLLIGCGAIDREMVKLTGKPVEICESGVLYYQFSSGSSVAYNKDGTVKNCKD